jgi:hypothetical protein
MFIIYLITKIKSNEIRMKCTFAYSQLDHQDIKMNAAVGDLARYNTQKKAILEATIPFN